MRASAGFCGIFAMVAWVAGCGGGGGGGAPVALDAAAEAGDDAPTVPDGLADVGAELTADLAQELPPVGPPCEDPLADLDGDGDPDCTDPDRDGDGFPDDLDCEPEDPSVSYGALEVCDGLDQNCNGLVDEGFPDLDGDGEMNCVDGDDDDDGIPDAGDVCPQEPDPAQDDLDGDGAGDPCDPDDDGDGVPDDGDVCPQVADPGQEDADGDGAGDACDPCPETPDAGADTDGDGVGDACDAFPWDPTEAWDHDGDGIGDSEDADGFDYGLLSYSYATPGAPPGEDLGAVGDAWPDPRHDRPGSGRSAGLGDLTSPVAASRLFLGGMPDPHAVDVLDLNGDGKEELVAVTGGRVQAFRTDGSLLWSTPVLGPGAQLLRGAGDLDGNGTTELVVMRGERPGAWWVLRGATGDVASGQEDWAGNPAISANLSLAGDLLEDVSGDGLPDLVAGGSAPGTHTSLRIISFGAGIDSPQVLHQWTTATQVVFQAALVGDVNGDPVPDLVLQDAYGTLKLLPLAGPTLAVVASVPTGGWAASILALRDLDGDGDDEILTLRNGGGDKSDGLWVLDGQDGGLAELWSDFTGDGSATRLGYPWDGPLADLDGDGDLDLAVAVREGEGAWLLSIRDALSGATVAQLEGRFPVEIVTVPGHELPVLISVDGGDDPYAAGKVVEALVVQGGSLSVLWSQGGLQPAWGGRLRYPVKDTIGCLGVDGGTCGLVHHADGEEAWGLFLRDDDGDGTPEVLAKVDLATGAVLATQAMYNPSGQQDVWFRVPRVVTDGLVRIVQLGSQGLSRLLDAGLHPKNKPYVLGSQAAGSPFLAGRGPGDLPVLFQGTPSGQVLSLLHTVDLATPVPLPLEPAGPPQAGILVGLLDRDGDDTHLALVQRSGGQDSVELALLSPPAEGDALWSWTLPPGKVLYNAAFPRLLAGGGEDVVLQLHDPQGPEGSLLVALAGSDGALRWSVSGQLPYASRPVRGMDLDGDGREEVVSGAHGSSLAFYSPEDGALLWDSDVSSGFDTQNVNALAAASLAPGGPGIVVASSIKVLGLQVVASEPWTVEALWSRPASLPTAPAILDLDGDGGDDVIYWTSNDGLLALDGGTGAVLWNRRFQGGDLLPEGSLLVGHSMAAPAAGDLDGNGTQELLVASSDGFLYALDAATGAVPLWRVFFGVRLFAPLLADLDGLGHLEAFVQTGDGYLYMLDQLAP